MICFHLGLSSSGSAFFQRFFQRFEEEKHYCDVANDILEDISYYSRVSCITEKAQGAKDVSKKINELQKTQGRIFFNGPNIPFTFPEFWEGRHNFDYIQIFNFLVRIKKNLEERCGELKIIISFQEQADWLLLSYLEYLGSSDTSSCYDFEARVLRLMESRYSMGPFRWLYYDKVLEEAGKRFCGKNVMMFSIESLKKRKSEVEVDVTSFLLGEKMPDTNTFDRDPFLELAALTTGEKHLEDGWFHIRSWLRSEIKNCFEASNFRARKNIKYFF